MSAAGLVNGLVVNEPLTFTANWTQEYETPDGLATNWFNRTVTVSSSTWQVMFVKSEVAGIPCEYHNWYYRNCPY